MERKLVYTALILAVLGLFWLWFYQADKKTGEIEYLNGQVTALEKQITEDQVERQALEDKIDSLNRSRDTLEIIKYRYLTKWDTVTAEKIISDPTVDSTIRATLDACLNVDRINNRIIRNLKAVNLENEALVKSLKGTIDDQAQVIDLRTAENDALRTQNKRLKRQRNAVSLVGLGLLVGILLY